VIPRAGRGFDLAAFSVRNWQFTAVLLALLTALGISSFLAIPKAEDPPFDAPSFGVIAVWPGASPAEIEQQVMDPLEDRIKALDDITKLEGRAEDGLAWVDVEFALDGTDPDDRYAELVRETQAITATLPEGLRPIEVIRYRPDTVSVLQLALLTGGASEVDVRRAAEAIEDAAESVPGVNEAEIHALPDERIDVKVDTVRLAAIGVPVGAVLQAIGSSDARLPGGHVDVGNRRLTVSTTSHWESIEALESTPVLAVGGEVLHLGDIATVERSHDLAQYQARYQGQPAVWIAVTFDDGVNVFGTRREVLEKTAAVALPEGARLETAFDQTENVAHRLKGFTRDFAIAIGLVLLTLLPLGLRASGIVMLAIPLSLAMGLTGLYWLGFTVNQLSIVGFVIALGLLVDDAIVVVENIARHIRNGESPKEAAIAGTREITYAVLGCTATLLFAFLPLLALPGTAGMFIRSMPLTVVTTILASLLLSLTVVPLLASRFLKPEPEHGNRVFQALEHAIERTFRPVLGRAMARPKTTFVASLVLFGLSLALVPAVGFSLFPKAGIPWVRVTIDTGEGASLAATNEAVQFAEAELRKHPEVAAVSTNTGAGNPRMYYNTGQTRERASVGELLVQLEEYDPHTTPAFLDSLRATFTDYPGARILVREFENGPPLDAPVAIRLLGDDLDALGRGSQQIADVLRGVDGLTQIDDPLAVRRTDVVVDIDRTLAAQRGVNVADVARTVRFGLAGLELGSFQDAEGEEIPIVARLASDGEPSFDQLAGLHVSTTTGATLPLAEVAKLTLQSGPPRIVHKDGIRSAVVAADVRTGRNVDALTKEALAKIADVELPEGVRWQVAGEAESRAQSFAGIGAAAIVAVMGVLAILVLEFGTFRSTLVVASVVPLGISGGILALFLTGNSLSFTATIGFVALMGIEVKNSILLVDFANQLRRRGMGLAEAIAQAGETRFVPILLTTLTALGGLVPLAFEGSALYSPLAIVLIGGLISSTLLARIVTPVVYLLLAPPLAEEDEAVAATNALPSPA
jgi:multidrug efflux pump subunit AcrB